MSKLSRQRTKQWVIRGLVLLCAFSAGLIVASTNCPVC